MSNFAIGYPFWFIGLCFIAGLLYSWLLYRSDNRFTDKPRWAQYGMKIIRFLVPSIICFLLLGPIFKSQKTEEKAPIIVTLRDQSQSISRGSSKNTLDLYATNFSALQNELKDKFDVVELSFGEKTQTYSSDSFNQKVTNISEALSYVYETYADQNIGAIILATDGIYNEGTSPVYSTAQFSAPVYTVGLGDTTIKRDLMIKEVLHNKIAYLGDKFTIQVAVGANNAANASSKVSLYKQLDNGQSKLMGEAPTSITGNTYFDTKNFVVDADQTGVVKYTAVAAAISSESNSSNNRKDFYVEVIDARQKVLIYANSPHPDLAALKDIISENKNYDVKVGLHGEAGIMPTDFDLVIYHNLPSRSADISATVNQLNKANINQWFFVGAQTDQVKFNASQGVISLSGNSQNTEVVEATLVAGFDKFTLSPELQARVAAYPPLIAPFGNYAMGGTSSAAFQQKIKKIPTNKPLIAFDDKGGVRVGVFVGEGIWKWRMQDLIDYEDQRFVSELVNKSIQYLSVKDDKRKFRVNTAKTLYKENEAILLDAQLYNDAYELINTPEVSITIKNSKGVAYNYTFSKVNNYYTLNTGLMPVGNYTYNATTNFNGKVFNATGKFSVEEIQLESYNLTAQHNELRTLSDKFNGKFVLPQDISSLALEIKNNEKLKPILYSSFSTKSLLDLKWLFFLLIALLGIEWFLRRYFGSY